MSELPLQEVELQQVCARVSVGLAIAVTPYMAATGVKLIRNQNIRPNKFDDSSVVFIQPSFAASQAKKTIRAGDVVIVRTGANIGDACVVPATFDGAQSFTTLVVRADQKQLSPQYLAQFINSNFGRSEVERLMAGGGKGNLNSGELKRFRIMILPIEGQKQIATLLAIWDSAIEKTEQLIAAKERHHSTMISRLITGRSKSESWTHNSIRDIADRIQRQGDGGEYPLLTISSGSGFVRQEDRYSRYMAGESAKTYTLLRAGEFSYNKGNSKRYEFGCVFQLQSYEVALVPRVYVSFRLHESVCAAYMNHLFAADYLKPQLRALVKTGVRNNGLLNIRPDEFMSTKVPLPPLDQQIRIANVLDAASTEIDLLRQQLATFSAQKRGLMQKLLTGQWRLLVPEEVSA
jgi:type I restriction enzyme S subunit